MRILNKKNWVFEWSHTPWPTFKLILERIFGGIEFSLYVYGIGFFIRYNTKKYDADYLYITRDEDVKFEDIDISLPPTIKETWIDVKKDDLDFYKNGAPWDK